MEAEISSSGDVMVEGQHVGQLNGFRFTSDPQAAGEEARTLNAVAQKALASEIEGRATRVHEAVDEAFVLANDGLIRWLGEPVGRITAGAHVLEPQVRIIADEQLTGPSLELVQRRLDLWVAQHVKKLLGPCKDLETGEGLDGIARGIAFQIGEALGVLERSKVAEELKTLSQEARAALRKLGVRFGAYHIYLPALVKPAPRALAAQLWALKNGGVEEVKGIGDVPHLAASGRTSFVADQAVPKGFYRAAGFRVCGERAVRVDILERLADLIRPAIAYRPGTTPGDPPQGAADGDGFVVTVGMTSLAGCSAEAFGSVLRSLGYVLDRRPGPAITVPLVPKAPTAPFQAPAHAADAADIAVADAVAADAAVLTTDAPAAMPEPHAPSPGGDLASRLSLARQSELIAAALEGGALDAIEPLPAPAEPAQADPAHVAPLHEDPLDGDALHLDAGEPAAPEMAVAHADVPTEMPPVVHPDEAAAAPAVSEPEVSSDLAAPQPDLVEDALVEGGPAIIEAPAAEPAQAAAEEQAANAQAAAATDGAADVTSLSESADAVGPQADVADDTAPAEVPLIEVWRPHRHNVHNNRRPGEARNRGPRRQQGGAGAAQNWGPHTQPDHLPATSLAPDESAGATGDQAGAQNRNNRFRDFKRPGGEGAPAGRDPHRKPGQGRDEREGRGGGGRNDGRRDGRREGGSGQGRRDERRDPGSQTTEAPRPRERQPDPNSPFAKLAALKAQLEREKS